MALSVIWCRIKGNQKWFIPGSIFKDYDFGHHLAYLVPEQSLGAEYRADYMLLGNNSIGHQIILVEFYHKYHIFFVGTLRGIIFIKRGIDLASFFNRYYRAGDVYQQGFPSRWAYVYDKIMSMLNANTADSFFDIILGKEYLIRDLGITEVEAAEKSEEILAEFNRIVGKDL